MRQLISSVFGGAICCRFPLVEISAGTTAHLDRALKDKENDTWQGMRNFWLTTKIEVT